MIFEGEYLNNKEMGKEKNIVKMVFYYLKGNIKIIKEMEKEKNIININLVN